MNTSKPHSTGCLVCGSKTIYTRGLCQTHYRRFMTKVKNFKTVDEAEEFEQRCLADGWILPKRRGGRPKERDAFDVIAEQVIAEGTRDIAAAVEDRRRKGVKKKAATRSTKRKSTAGE